MKPFSLEEYLKNPKRKIVTRDGRNVRIICTDHDNISYPIVGAIKGYDFPFCFSEDGCVVGSKCNDANDLFFSSVKHEGYTCIHFNEGIYYLDDTIYASKEEADNNAKRWNDSIATIKVEWED